MLSPLEEALLGVMMIVIMFGMGSSLTFRDFRLAIRSPKPVLVGFSSQYLLMPLIAYILSRVLDLTPAQTVGLVLIGCMPGGTTSNIFAYFSKSLLSMSIVMTVCSTLGAVIMVPLLMDLYTSGMDASYRIPSSQIASLLFVLLVPVLMGMTLRRKYPNAGALVELVGGILGVLVILFLIGSWVPRNWPLLITTNWQVYAAVILIGLLGIGFGYFFSKFLGLDNQRSRTVSLETGIQNGPLAVLVVSLVFVGDLQQGILLMPVMYSLFIIFTSTLTTLVYRRATHFEELARDQAKVEPT